jgi:hypothetical protein
MAYNFVDEAPIESHEDSPWTETESSAGHAYASDSQWAKMSDDFTNVTCTSSAMLFRHSCRSQAGYREGITAGKEAAAQEGFDAGFALVGAPLGHEIGLLRGTAAALLAFLSASPAHSASNLQEAQSISAGLSAVRFSDIEPRDLEAEAHAREHLAATGTADEDMEIVDGPLKDKADAEMLEDMLGALSTSGSSASQKRPTMDDVRALRSRLEALCQTVGIVPDFS